MLGAVCLSVCLSACLAVCLSGCLPVCLGPGRRSCVQVPEHSPCIQANIAAALTPVPWFWLPQRAESPRQQVPLKSTELRVPLPAAAFCEKEFDLRHTSRHLSQS